MFKFLFTLFLIVLTQQCSDIPQQASISENLISPIPLAELPKKLDESSGLEVVNGRIYSINDSGGKPELFVFDSNGKNLNNIKIKHVKNKDWETLAANSTHFFIGDFGNNSGNREDLTIYNFPIEDLDKDKIKADKINFKYANQTNYTNKKRKHSFDGEAIIAMDSSLVIFSKDWVDNKTQVYHVPLNSMDETVLISPSEELAIDALITGADYDAKSQKLVLCGYNDYHNYICIFEGSTPDNFLTQNFKKFELEGLYKAQVEGVAFITENQILISTEETKKFKQQMWTIDLNQ